jgi:hypothetical protein
MNPISKWWLNRRQRIVRSFVSNSIVVDCGARTEKIILGAIGFDIAKGSDLIADARCLPFRDHSIDTLVGCELIEHMNFKDIEAYVLEARRTSSYLVISTPNADSTSWSIFWYFWQRTFGRPWRHTHIALYCSEFLDSFFTEYGWQINKFVKTRWSLFYDLVSDGKKHFRANLEKCQ